MMLRDRWGFAALLGLALVLTALWPGFAPGQAARQKPRTVQPAQGPPPDQAVEPDVSEQLPHGQTEQFPEPVVPVEVPPPAPAPKPEPAPVAAVPAAAPAPPPIQIVEPEPIPAKTPEGRKLQKETATLLQLAKDLKAEIEKAGNNTLSLAALRKAEEIQRMSKDLKQEMNQQGQPVGAK